MTNKTNIANFSSYGSNAKIVQNKMILPPSQIKIRFRFLMDSYNN
jgi:hypothetical protein